MLVYRLPIEHATGNGSITNPGESNNPGLLAVGATHYWDTNTIASYSGRGPTPDSRPKPDIVGTACAATVSYPPSPGSRCWFAGTSQASPHVAGMAALVRQRFPDYIPVQVATYLKDHAERRGTVPNNTWGHGFAVLPPIGGCSNNPGLAADCAMLLAARDTLAGTGTLNWSANAPITTWDGVTMGGSPLRVTKIRLSDKGLTGEIPSELGSLANLQVLHLTRNQLTGPIPAELGGLTNLSILALGGNELTGGITTELGRLSKLERLYLWGNQLTGGIPTQLGSLAKLERLELADNQLTGPIPAELGGLPNLTELFIWGNQLSGEIPPQLGNLAGLTELHLDGNQLTGEIPTELGELTNLARLALDKNQLTGSIPPTLSNLAKLEELHLTRNQLAGPIPPELGGLVKLSILALGGNGLTGEIPGRLGDLTNLTELFLWGNQLTGEIPSELGGLTNLTVLSVSDNQLTGTIPTRLGSLTDLEELSLWGNQLTGEIPAELGSLASLEKLLVHENQLTGQIPSELGNLANLVLLSLSRNNLTGEIPAELGNLASLEELYLWYNQLTGEIPPELSRLTNLEALGLSDNQLIGEIPAEFGNLSSLVSLHLSDNQLTGTIPPELGNLANLERLYLFDNQLTGTIPAELGDLTNLAHLRLDGNQLTGEIPSELGRLANLTLLYLSGNQLTGCVPHSLRDVADNDFVQLQLAFCASEEPPGVTVSHAGMDPAAPVRIGTAIPVAATFTKTVTGFTVDDVTVDNASVGNFLGSDAAYTFDVTPNAIGQVTVDIPANMAQDADGNGNTAAAQLRLGIPYDDNGNGLIERSEVIKAINDYLGAGSVERSHVIALINLYLSPDPTWSPGGAPAKETVVFSDLNWNSVMLQNDIAQFIVEHGYGYPTDTVFGSSLPLLQGLRRGDTHVTMEIWIPNHNPAWEEALASGDVISLGPSLGSDWQSAFVIPAYLQEQYPELDSVEDLKEQQYKDLFATSESGGKARLVSCVLGWHCELVNAAQVAGYGLNEHVQIVNPGDQDSLFASINGAYRNREPWLGYMWGTGEPALLLDLVRLEEPAYSDECWETTKACAYEDATILIGAHSGLPDQAPDVAEFLRSWDFTIDPHLKNVVRWQKANPDAPIKEAALYWIRNNEDAWSGWVTAEAAARIRSALSES